MDKKLIYLDYNSTTPVDSRVLDAMMPYLTIHYGNAASRSHPFGWRADSAVAQAREQLADLLSVEPREVVFTSGATEAINIALKGIFESYRLKGNHIITAKTEHKAVLDVCERLEKSGALITYLDVNAHGLIDLEELQATITKNTIAVAIMWTNNETGLIHPMAKIGAICQQKDVILFCDATQVVGKLPISPVDVGIHVLACSAHKFYGPKGIGALYVRSSKPRIKIAPLIDGGGHEQGLRSGTLNVPAIVGLGKAAAIAKQEMAANKSKIEKLRDILEKALLQIEESYLNPNTNNRMYNVTNISFRYVESEALIGTFNQTIAVSTGSACTSASLEPSHVLLAMGLSKDKAYSAIRFSLGVQTTQLQIEKTIQFVEKGVKQLRAQSPVWKMFKDGVDVDALL